jgi:mannose-1-phosphate guanylyltransferase / mannose-6-phosphate isomerase
MRIVLPFVLCGGVGTRLWPLSREAFPKQFHKIVGSETLLQQTCRRLEGDLFGRLSILANHRQRFLIEEQLKAIGLEPQEIVLEPVGRNTAPASCIAALVAEQTQKDALVLLAPSDHVIADAKVFANAVAKGMPSAEDGALVVFGVKPDNPHTGYGYIETDGIGDGVVTVKRFVEKPTQTVAEAFFQSGQFYWNSGIFLFRAANLLEMLETYAPEIVSACRRAIDDAVEDLGFVVLGNAYAEAPANSLDYAVAEKTHNLRCVKLDTRWSDVGSWPTVWDMLPKDTNNNVACGGGEIVLRNTKGTLAYSDHPCVALLGLDNIVVVATEDAVLVASKQHVEEVRVVVEQLKRKGSPRALQHNRVYRPWGWYQTLSRGEGYQVKCIMVKPGGKLSLQSHEHRAEHWVVVKGTLKVTKGDRAELLNENQSTYIPIGEKHRLSNPGPSPAFLIEVQSGGYLGEDDIVRFEDVYRRGSHE